jgi:glycosyltransferase involved in cell wall biosynthesis
MELQPPVHSVAIALPLYLTEGPIPQLLKAIAELRLVHVFVVGVDDGSADRSAEVFEEWATRLDLPHLLVRHPANRGQSAALLTGLMAVEAESYVAMDADLEDDPASIPMLLAVLADDRRELVFADRVVAPAHRPLSSALFKTIVIRVSGWRLPNTVGLYCAMTRSLRDRVIATVGEQDHLLAALLMLAHDVGVVRCPPRTLNAARPSSYTLAKKLRAAARAGRSLWRLRSRHSPNR